MSTANFSTPTLSKVYASQVNTDWDYEDNIMNVLCELESLKDFYKVDKWIDNTTKAIGAISIDVYNWEYKQWDELPLYITVESGYYGGMMFDVDNSEFNQSYEYKETQSLENRIERASRQVERVLEQNTTPLLKVAQFSNGEAIYAYANSTKAQIKSALLD